MVMSYLGPEIYSIETTFDQQKNSYNFLLKILHDMLTF